MIVQGDEFDSGTAHERGISQLNLLVTEILRKSKRHPVLLKALNREVARSVESFRAGLVASVLKGLIDSGMVLDLGDGEYFLAANIHGLEDRMCKVIQSQHSRYPYEPGVRAGEIKKRFAESKSQNSRKNIDPRLFDLAMTACKEDGLVEEGDYGLRLSGFVPLTSEDAEIARVEREILGYIADTDFGRINLDQLSVHLDIETRMTRSVVSGMLEDGRLIRIAEGRLFEPSAIEGIAEKLLGEFDTKARMRTADITKALGLTRSKAIPLLEFFDEIGFTRRSGDFRQLAASEVPDIVRVYATG